MADTFIKFDRIPGESTSDDHSGEVEVLSWSWGLTAAQPPAGGGGGTDRATPRALACTHFYDKASPVLAKKAASGAHLPKAVLSTQRPGGQRDYLTVTLKEVVVTSIELSGPATGLPMETVSLAYRDVEFGYRPQKSDGSLGAVVKFGWDTVTGQVR